MEKFMKMFVKKTFLSYFFYWNTYNAAWILFFNFKAERINTF